MSILTPIAVGIRFPFSSRSTIIFLVITHCYYGIISNFGMPIPGEHEDITRHIEPMDISVKGKNLDVGDALSSHVGAHLDGAVTKYFNHAIDATAIFSREGQDMCADISVDPVPPGFVVQSGGEAEHHYTAFDDAQDRVAKQLRPYKRKLVNHHAKNRTVDNVLPKRQYWLDRSGQHVAVAENDRIT